jgi:hypothetical protein
MAVPVRRKVRRVESTDDEAAEMEIELEGRNDRASLSTNDLARITGDINDSTLSRRNRNNAKRIHIILPEETELFDRIFCFSCLTVLRDDR